ncbi:phosphotransferase [Paenibacillus luteus]|uniref:phosphotransferase n=1 Tax=Paenibacillus luteus TaxID=2545753 RepID=UPI0011411E14|nr:phosphotransferase [Paenibacillus luteus]
MSSIIDFTAYLDNYKFQERYVVENRESGMNNTTRIITSGDRKFVFRIYNNHKDPDIVRLEHEVLQQLNEQELSFQVPVPVYNKCGDTVSIAPDGTLSALFDYIEGDRPSIANERHVYALGHTAAKLTEALGKIDPKRKPLYSPYYSLEDTYASMDLDSFLSLTVRSTALAARKPDILALHEERERLILTCRELALLPQQWIHGDLVFNNTVSHDDDIIGVLDFEFATIDARVMELAVIIVDLIKPGDPHFESKLKLLLHGYQAGIQLSEEERKQLPALMKLRLLDVALHFAVRLRDNLDETEILCGIIDQSLFGCNWINDHWEADYT